MLRLAFAFLLIAAAPASAVPFVYEDQTRVEIGCAAEYVEITHVIAPYATAGARVGAACGFSYSISVSLQQTGNDLAVALSAVITDLDPSAPAAFIRGDISVILLSPWNTVSAWDGYSLDPMCEEAPCDPLWVTDQGGDWTSGLGAWIGIDTISRDGSPIERTYQRTALFVPSTPEPGTALLVVLGLAATASVRPRSR